MIRKDKNSQIKGESQVTARGMAYNKTTKNQWGSWLRGLQQVLQGGHEMFG